MTPVSQIPRQVGRFLWRLLPAPLRYALYQRTVSSNHSVIRGFWKVVAAWRVVSLWNHRMIAKEKWPDARGIDHLALAAWGALLRFHWQILDAIWSRAHWLRRWRKPSRGAQPGLVLHVTGSFDLGGSQTQIRNLCDSPSSRYRHTATEIFPEMNYLYRQGVRIAASDYVQGGVFRRTAGRLVVDLNYRSSQIVQIYKVFCDIRRARPEIVVGWGHEMSITAFIAASLARVPHIVFCIRTTNPTYLWVPKFLGDMMLRAHRRASSWASAIIVNSTFLRRDHSEWSGVAEERIRVCANGVDPGPARPAAERAAVRQRVRAELGASDDTVLIVNVGRFSPEKGQRTIIEANAMLLKRTMPVPFLWALCGDGPTLEPLQQLAQSTGAENIRFLGRTTGVKDVLLAADIFVMPSDFEGMPNAMMEAMTAGLPCISTNRSGAMDVARDGSEALYYEPRDALGLAQHLRALLEHPEERQRLGAAAASRISEFTVERSTKTFDGVLSEVTAACATSQ